MEKISCGAPSSSVLRSLGTSDVVRELSMGVGGSLAYLMFAEPAVLRLVLMAPAGWRKSGMVWYNYSAGCDQWWISHGPRSSPAG